MIVSQAIEKMVFFYNGNLHDVNHFLKVWAYAKTIGEQESLDTYTQQTLELATIVHDIACPLCREKYGSVAGPYQEKEGIPLTEKFYEGMYLPKKQLERICYLVGHHHTLEGVKGMDYQILLEADFLVNADEGNLSVQAIEEFKKNVFKTKTGLNMLNSIYKL